ncbi:MAG: glutathione peroxidase [Polyangiaceae bacterium]|nr:glutathione peroxidase [Polyangiaceae bacterium]
MTIYDLTARDIDGADRRLDEYRGKVLLIVNVASRCGLTPHYAGLNALHDELSARGLVVLGFPCNQFGGQEPGTEPAIKEFCSSRYDVKFPMFAKVDVNGPSAHPLFAHLTAAPTAPDGPGDIAWNFAKFVIDREGRVAARFAPPTAPDAPELRSALESALGPD